MYINVCCNYFISGGYCNNSNIKKSLFGLGAKCCIKYPILSTKCKYYDEIDIGPPPALYTEMNMER